MEGILNEVTRTVHKPEGGGSEFRTECGITNHVAPDQLRRTPIERATDRLDASKCGRCFDDGGGY